MNELNKEYFNDYCYFNLRTNGDKITFDDDDEQDNGIDHWTEGSFQRQGEWLNIILEETVEMSGSSRSALFKKDGTEWVAQFSPELLPGVPDTLIDLNADGKEELIMKERNWNSAGANINYVFYARNPAGEFKKISDIAKSIEGYSPMQFTKDNPSHFSELKYVPSGGVVMIKVNTTRSWWLEQERGSEQEKETITYSWDGTALQIKH